MSTTVQRFQEGEKVFHKECGPGMVVREEKQDLFRENPEIHSWIVRCQ
jgi:hypothetical protein